MSDTRNKAAEAQRRELRRVNGYCLAEHNPPYVMNELSGVWLCEKCEASLREAQRVVAESIAPPITATPDPWREKAKVLAREIDWNGRDRGISLEEDALAIMRELGFKGYGEGEQ